MSSKNKVENKDWHKKSEIINIIGIKDEFIQLPYAIKKMIFEFTWPKLKIDIENAKNFPGIDKIHKSILDKISSGNIKINNQDVRLLDTPNILAIDSTAYAVTRYLLNREKTPEMIARRCGDVKKTLTLLQSINKKTLPLLRETFYKNSVELINLSWAVLSKHYDFTKPSLYFTLDTQQSQAKKLYQVLKIHEYQPVKKSFYMDGKPRDGYLCVFLDGRNINPIVLNKNVINNILPMKVYIQDHAINRIYERLNLGDDKNGDIFANIGESLINPEVVCKNGDAYLISLYSHNSPTEKYKLGYLVIGFADDAALIRSFKFITMTGTPEHIALKTQLGACRQDLEHFDLDTINFIYSDVFKDSKLKQILKKCNLSHLLNLRVESNAPEASLAEDMKKYFRID